MPRIYRQSGLQSRHRTQNSKTAAPGFGFPGRWHPDRLNTVPPPEEILSLRHTESIDGQCVTVHVFEGRPAWSMDLDALVKPDTVRMKNVHKSRSPESM